MCGDIVDNDVATAIMPDGGSGWLKRAVVDKPLVSCLKVVDRASMV
jgi:hypothetical protein